MTDYKSMYEDLFKAVTEAIEILKEAQIRAEHTYITTAEPIVDLSDEIDIAYIAEYEC